MPHFLDFATLPVVDRCRVFVQLNDEAINGIAPFQRLCERASNAVRFAYWSECSADILRCHKSEEKQLREGCFRAALTEFVSMEEVQGLDYQSNGLIRKPIRLNEIPNPLLHLFRELRNLEVHLRHSELRPIPKDLLWGNPDRPEEAKPISIDIWVLEGITFESFTLLRNAKNYTEQQIKQLVSWFNETQESWGVHELFCLAIEEYCRHLKV